MKVNHYAVLPAAVRYDGSLTDKAILLFAEIAAASNTYGVCEEDNAYFSSALRVDTRTISRAMAQLVERGHISRITEFNKRKIKLNLKLLERSSEQVPEEEPLIPDDVPQYADVLIETWDRGLGCKTEKREMYIPLIRARLVRFTKEELLSSVKNRIAFVTKISEWHQMPENRHHQANIDILLRDDDSVLKYLNMKLDEPKRELKPFGL